MKAKFGQDTVTRFRAQLKYVYISTHSSDFAQTVAFQYFILEILNFKL